MNKSIEEFNETDLTGWTDLSKLFRRATVLELTDIMDDALANGFEFKLHGSHIYYRERTE